MYIPARKKPPQPVHLDDYRPPDHLVERVQLTVELHPRRTLVRSRIAFRRNPAGRGPGAPLTLYGADLELVSLHLDGAPVELAALEVDEEQVLLPGPLPERFELAAEVVICPEDNSALEGLYRSRGLYCTQCEAEGFRRITLYPDRPDVLAPFAVRLIADPEECPVLLSNGNPAGGGRLADGRHYADWHDPFPKPSYLFALVAGRLGRVEGRFRTASGRDVALHLYAAPRDLDKLDFALEALREAMAWDERVYGREYDLDVYMIAAVEDFNMGAMENKGLNLFNVQALLACPELTTDAGYRTIRAVVAHEYFHNWSGNRVTLRDWFQLSLKEGFTVFRESQFSADFGSPAVRRIEEVELLRERQFAEDEGPLAHPVRPRSYLEISNFYTLTVYEKGAEVVRMLHALLGPERFRAGCDLYFARHDGCAATVEDFLAAMEEASGRDLQQFLRWYDQAGTPRVAVNGRWDPEAGTYTLEFEQSCPPTPDGAPKFPLLIPVRLALIGRQGPVPLYGGGAEGAAEAVVALAERRQTVVFREVREPVVPSLFRGFSAPVRWHFPYGRDDLKFLMDADTDGFNRYEAWHRLALEILVEQVRARLDGRQVPLDERLEQAFARLLSAPPADRELLARMLKLPTEDALAEAFEPIPIHEIHEVRQGVARRIAERFRSHLLTCREAHRVAEPARPDPEQMGRRALANAALGYLTLLDDPECARLAHRQALEADNMTDVYAALGALVDSPSETCATLGREALEAFYRRWRDEPLAVDRWFEIQAAASPPGGVERVDALTRHEAFDARNPNRVRALLGTFAHRNHVNFHRRDGAGYRLLARWVLTLDAGNPQLAARLAVPLTRYRRLPPGLALQMRAALEQIAAAGPLSPDLYEVVHKALAEGAPESAREA
ncbi:MAG: aminopeptidase N [Porticoccaceae bacterium]|nr:MAG: aminopeptidase N [Porticoccaceae bacterium]